MLCHILQEKEILAECTGPRIIIGNIKGRILYINNASILILKLNYIHVLKDHRRTHCITNDFLKYNDVRAEIEGGRGQ